jgi:membrane protease YdiL (CAAX protease family)
VSLVRCPGCGVVAERGPAECLACGTFLSPAPTPPASFEAAAPPPPTPERLLDGARGVARLFVAVLALGVVTSIATALGADERRLDLVMTSIFAVLALVCAVSARADLAPLLRTTGGARGALAALLGFGLLVAGGALYFRAFRVLGYFMPQPSGADGWPRWSAYALTALAPGVFEELAFRGYVMARLEPLLSRHEVLIVQAALFSLLHLGPVVFPSHFGIGLVLGLLRRRTGSLYPGMAVHTAWNAMIVYADELGRAFP